MEPIYFGNSIVPNDQSPKQNSTSFASSPLLGLYHPPESFQSKEPAVLICYPILQEHIRSYRACFNLANKLASVGCHVLRFDYFGTGDSLGTIEEASLQRWIVDVEEAIDELIKLSGQKSISVIGLRFGAALAALQQKHLLNQLILWDPIINGANYLSSLRSIQDNITIGVERFSKPRNLTPREGVEELTGFSIPKNLIKDIETINLIEKDQWSSKQIDLVASENISKYQQLINTLSSNLTTEEVAEPSYWESVSKIEDMLMPYQVIAHLSRKVMEP